MSDLVVNVIGAGLAGVEATYQLTKRGIKVKLYEMRPIKNTEAHHTSDFAELVCSNSLRSNSLENAVGILKEEMRQLDSIIMKFADEYKVEAGSSLAVDRLTFSRKITEYIKSLDLVEVIYEEVTELPSGPTIVTTGPLTSSTLCQSIKNFLGEEYLSFYDAAAPLIKKSSIDLDKVYLKSRYDKGEAAYYNAAMSKEEYDLFYNELINAETVILKDFEKQVFEGCMPIEVMAKRGYKTMLFGPLKPVGLERSNDDKPFAVIQLRQDDAINELLNIVGFQTNLKFSEQKRILKLVPGFENIEISRFGVMHKNIFINSPKSINKFYQSNKRNDLFFAGQLTGVEGYVESSASGLLASLNMVQFLKEKPLLDFESTTVITSMANYISNKTIKNFQPMNANFELLKSLPKHDKNERKKLYCKRALEVIDEIKSRID